MRCGIAFAKLRRVDDCVDQSVTHAPPLLWIGWRWIEAQIPASVLVSPLEDR